MGTHLNFGRAFKLDRTSVVATALALQEWMEMDHEQRWLGYRRQAEEFRLAAAGEAPAMLGCFTFNEHVVPEPLPEKFEPLRDCPRSPPYVRP
ncbi:MAG TPA: hypothetical protein VNH38_04945 [Candidatus Dormibacteraeota bacterium]|nr:hypothetical protein [Candidatus Dormibacteraeota bacterium]